MAFVVRNKYQPPGIEPLAWVEINESSLSRAGWIFVCVISKRLDRERTIWHLSMSMQRLERGTWFYFLSSYFHIFFYFYLFVYFWYTSWIIYWFYYQWIWLFQTEKCWHFSRRNNINLGFIVVKIYVFFFLISLHAILFGIVPSFRLFFFYRSRIRRNVLRYTNL